jgi:thiamine-phosphate pyrophosphorylase
MRRRQTVPRQWLIIVDPAQLDGVRRLALGSGLLVLVPLSPIDLRHLRHEAKRRKLSVAREGPRSAARVHNMGEFRRALSAGTPLIFLSPLYPTASHPDWKPLPRMRAAALARLGGRRLFALGGMDARKFERVKKLGFQGWAGISAFRT